MMDAQSGTTFGTTTDGRSQLTAGSSTNIKRQLEFDRKRVQSERVSRLGPTRSITLKSKSGAGQEGSRRRNTSELSGGQRASAGMDTEPDQEMDDFD